jgi:hypothetical protein
LAFKQYNNHNRRQRQNKKSKAKETQISVFEQRISNCMNLLATEGSFLQITNGFGGVAQLVRA